MDCIEFDESLHTGDPRVDAQHEALIRICNELVEAGGEGSGSAVVQPILERLHAYTLDHFMAEQRLMRESGYPQDRMQAHIREHEHLTQRVRQLILDYSSGDLTSATPVAALMEEWLSGHIRRSDRDVVDHLRTPRDSARRGMR